MLVACLGSREDTPFVSVAGPSRPLVSTAGAILARVDIPSFLRMYPPFDELDEERLAEVVRHTHIEFFPAGTAIVHRATAPSAYLYVVRKGLVEAVDGDLVADALGEGEFFGFVSLFTGLEAAFTLRAAEDTICYLIDAEVATEVMATRRGLAFLAGSLRRREVSVLEGSAREAVDPWAVPVSALIRREPLVVPATMSAREAAGLMTRERISSVLVDQGDALGILTDRDLRAKVVAGDRDPGNAVGELMTAPIVSVEPATTAGEALSLMFERGIHHVPVREDGGRLLGIVTDTDLMGVERWKPFALRSEIERAASADEAIAVASGLRRMVATLVEADVPPLDIAHAVAVTIDTLTTRLLDLTIGELGDPPCPWAWLALGSEARHEQGLATDQDNALVVECDEASFPEVDVYFQRLTTALNLGVERAGIPRCRAGVIASNAEWRGTLRTWEDRFWGWIREPARTGRAFVGIAFDYRRVTGPLDVEATLDDVIRSAASEDQFVRQLGTLAVATRPPAGLLKGTITHPKGRPTEALDVKEAGIGPITNLARVLTIESGITENRTLRRLGAVAEIGRIDQDELGGLQEAFGLLWQIRLEAQARAVERGAEPDNTVHPTWLGPLTRQALREAFRIVDAAQDRLAARLGLRR
jgi:CBS domain-containing protein